MSTLFQANGVDQQVNADLDAMMKNIIDGTPLDPETSRRIDERADRITEKLRRLHGVISDAAFDELLRGNPEVALV